MKLYAECIACQVRVRLKDVENFVSNEDGSVKIMKDVVEVLNGMLKRCRDRYDNSCVPTVLATNLFRYLKSAIGLVDPYRELKKRANKEALGIYREVRQATEKFSSFRDKLYTAVKISIVGNTLDTGVAGYTPPNVNDVMHLLESLEVYGDLDLAVDMLAKADTITIIMDNSGEAVLDRVLADVLREAGKKVVAVVKGGAFQNDITLDDVGDAGLHESFDLVVDTGTDASSIFLNEVKPKVLEVLDSADVIVSKGMANYEYITEVEGVLKKPIIYMLVAKCPPIARDIGVYLGRAVVKVVDRV